MQASLPMPSERVIRIAKVIGMCMIADPKFLLDDKMLLWVAEEISKDYAHYTTEEIHDIIINGIKGKYSDGSGHYSINSRVLYDWLFAGRESTADFRSKIPPPIKYPGEDFDPIDFRKK